jgi:hypothetical protein
VGEGWLGEGHTPSAEAATDSNMLGATPTKRQPTAPPMTVCAANTSASGGVAAVTAARCMAAEHSMGPTRYGAGSRSTPATRGPTSPHPMSTADTRCRLGRRMMELASLHRQLW